LLGMIGQVAVRIAHGPHRCFDGHRPVFQRRRDRRKSDNLPAWLGRLADCLQYLRVLLGGDKFITRQKPPRGIAHRLHRYHLDLHVELSLRMVAFVSRTAFRSMGSTPTVSASTIRAERS